MKLNLNKNFFKICIAILFVILVIEFVIIGQQKKEYNELMRELDAYNIEVDEKELFYEYIQNPQNFKKYLDEYAKENGYIKEGETLFVAE